LGQQPGATSFEGTKAGIPIHGAISAGVDKNRVYAAYGVGANGVIQILDRKKLLTAFKNPLKPTAQEMLAPQVGFITMSPDQGGHTAFPVFGEPIPEFQDFVALKRRDLLIVPSEASRGDHCAPDPNGSRPGPHLAFLLDISNEAAPWPISTFRVPENPGDFCGRGGRFGTHAVAESFYPPYYGKIAVFSWFNAGTRVFDIRDPFAVREVAYFIPAPDKYTTYYCPDAAGHPAGDPKVTAACARVIETNNVEIDDRGLIYSADRAGTGLDILRLTGYAKEIVEGK
ncbi:MAG: LVIVD repeat-containing protein, partial [Candidatus Acidiferrales bacterium]